MLSRPSSALTDWRLVRGLAQFQLLNRVSMAMLVLVPLLTSIWPVVPFAIATYNGTIGRLETTLDRAAATIRVTTTSSTVAPDSIRTELLKGMVWAKEQLMALETQSTGNLPTTLAVLFFAALAVLLGRTVFDLLAPETIRIASRDGYVQLRKREYTESPSQHVVERALKVLVTQGEAIHLAAEEQNEQNSNNRQLGELYTRVRDAEQSLKDAKEKSKDSISGYMDKAYAQLRDAREDVSRFLERDRGERGPGFRRRVSLVEEAARLEYMLEARRRRAGMVLAATLYTLGLALILFVIGHQSRNVASAAGWLSSVHAQKS